MAKNKKIRLGRVEVMHEGYVVDMDDEMMVQEAKDALREDMTSISFRIVADKKATINDIPEFLMDGRDDREAQNDRDHKRGLYGPEYAGEKF